MKPMELTDSRITYFRRGKRSSTPVVTIAVNAACTSSILNCATLMIAEKASDLTAGRAPLAPEHLAYYRARNRTRAVD